MSDFWIPGMLTNLWRTRHSAVTERRGYNAGSPRLAKAFCGRTRQSHLLFALRRSGNKIALWPMTISPKAGVTGTFCEG